MGERDKEIMKEEWLPVKEYEGFYEVSSLGRVRSVDHMTNRLIKGKILKQHLIKKGSYFYIRLNGRRKKKNIAVHRLVAMAFIPNSSKKLDVNHINGHKKDNRVTNLEWTTPKENSVHAAIHGLMPRGEKHPNSKLTTQDVIEIRSLSSCFSERELAKKFHVHRAYIGAIVRKERWAHVV